MYIIQKNYTGGNGRGTLEYNLENSETSHEVPAKQWDPYEDKDKYLKLNPETRAEQPTEEHISDNSARVREMLSNQKVAGISDNNKSLASKPRVQDEIVVSPSVEKELEWLDASDSQDVYHTLMEDERRAAKREKLGKAGLIGAGLTAVGAAGYGAYKAWQKKKKEKKEKGTNN